MFIKETNMSFDIYDYRTDIRNVLVTPQIRSRFLRMEPGQSAQRHSHDLGHEIFLILQGQCEFEISGDKQVLGPGQMCVALADEIHCVRVVGDEPMIMYLSVTPHIHPTHTMRTDDGERLPPRFAPPSAYDLDPDVSISVEDLIDRQVEAAEAVAKAAQASADAQKNMADKLKQAIADGDEQTAIDTRNAMWDAIYAMHKSIYDFGDVWNELAPRAAEVKKSE
jgi:quercetin dioxygenase-like cupin family protein